MRDHVVALGDDEMVLSVSGSVRIRVEQTVAVGRAVLDVAVRPIAFRSSIVALAKLCHLSRGCNYGCQ